MLTLTAADKKAISALVELGQRRPVKLTNIVDLAAANVNVLGDDASRVVELRAGKQRYRVAYSHELQRIGLMRHISISSDKAMHVEDVNDILKRFGYEAQLSQLTALSNPPHYEVWLEPIAPKKAAINVLEVIKDEPQARAAATAVSRGDDQGSPTGTDPTDQRQGLPQRQDSRGLHQNSDGARV